MSEEKNKVIVIGGGLAGLAACMTAAEAGLSVDLVSIMSAKRSHSVCAQGGINGAVNTKGEGDDPEIHFDDTIYGGDFLANQSLVKEMCYEAPKIIYLMDRLGVTFNRTNEGLLDFRRFGGTLFNRTAFAGATTGQQLIYALDEQVRKHESEGKINRYEGFTFVKAILDDNGKACGAVIQDLASMKLIALKGEAVIMATGGIGAIFGKSTNSAISTGYAACSIYKQGAYYANGEFIQVHPTTVPGADKLRLISESVRGEGGRVWTYKDGKPWYFLEERYPKYGNLVPRDVATREIFNVVYDDGLGVDGKPQVYLDVTHLDPDMLDRKLKGVLEIYEMFVGDDPKKVPMRIFPGMHYSMGGIWVDNEHMTNIPNLFAIGECEYQYHGANRLGANSLVACIFAGMRIGRRLKKYIENKKSSYLDVPNSVFDNYIKDEEKINSNLLNLAGPENPYKIHKELGELMTENVTVRRFNDKLKNTDEKLLELKDRMRKLGLPDRNSWNNSSIVFVRELYNMLDLARVITIGALLRNESRGAHYKEEYPERDDENFLKTTKALYNKENDSPDISYEEVDTSLLKPRKRSYQTSE